MLSEMSPTKKDKYSMLSIYCGIKKRERDKLIEREYIVVKGWGLGEFGNKQCPLQSIFGICMDALIQLKVAFSRSGTLSNIY